MISDQRGSEHAKPPFVPSTIHRLAVPIILAWVAIVFLVSTCIPSLEEVAAQRQVSLSPKDAPSVVAMERMGQKFKESDSDSFAMIVLEGQQKLGDDAHRYYNSLIRQLKDDQTHVQHVQDFWGDPLTAPGAESPDGKCVYVQLNLAGNQGTTLGDESIKSVRNIVNRTPPPKGVTTYVTGPAALVADMHHSGDSTLVKITVVTLLVIFTMLLLVYRSVITVVLLLVMVGIELTAARGIVAFLGYHQLIGLSLSLSICWYPLALRPERTTESSSSAAIRRRAKSVRTVRPPSTPLIAVSPMLCWHPV
jgi:putative drug exporter of the RND superfamily